MFIQYWSLIHTIEHTQTVVVSSDDDDPTNFKAAVVSIGMYGVLSEITLRVDYAFNLREIRSPKTLDYCLENLDSLVNGHTHVKFWVEFYNNFCVLYQTNKTEENHRDNPGWFESFVTVSHATFSSAAHIHITLYIAVYCVALLYMYIIVLDHNHVYFLCFFAHAHTHSTTHLPSVRG